MPKKYLYVLAAPTYGTRDFVKVGVTDCLESRLAGCRRTIDHLLELVASYETERAREIESQVKRQFRNSRYFGHETFLIDRDVVLDYVAVLCR